MHAHVCNTAEIRVPLTCFCKNFTQVECKRWPEEKNNNNSKIIEKHDSKKIKDLTVSMHARGQSGPDEHATAGITL